MTNQPKQFKHADVVRAFKAASAAGVHNPTVHIRCPNGSVITIDGKPDEGVAAGKAIKQPPRPAAEAKPPSKRSGK